MITTAFQTQVVPMPVCRYDILDAAENGNVVQYAIIGQAAFHKWTCDTDTGYFHLSCGCECGCGCGSRTRARIWWIPSQIDLEYLN